MSTENYGTNRRYRCFDCGDRFDGLQYECPGCGGTEFKTGMADEDSTDENSGMQAFAGLTAPLNPYVPK